MDIKDFEKIPVMGILRGIKLEVVEPLIEASIEAGLKSVEITMNTPKALELIAKAKQVGKKRIYIGAGTVITEKDCTEAISIGSEFIVMPANNENIIKKCVDKNIPVFPGAFTPTEVINAWENGASMVKLFPAGMFGPKYIKELKGPFNNVKIMAVGGVRPENIEEHFLCGASGIAFGGSVFKNEWIRSRDFDSIKNLIKKYVDITRKVGCKDRCTDTI